MQELQNLFTQKQPLFVVSSMRAKKDFYIHAAIKNKKNYNLQEVQEIERDNEILKNCFALFEPLQQTNINEAQTMLLPHALTIDEFFRKATFSQLAQIPKNVRDFFMFQALQNIKQKYAKDAKITKSFLNFEASFLLFLQTSSTLLHFYDELREHKIPITKESLLRFREIDSYDEYGDQLLLLATIYEEYALLLESNNLTDSLAATPDLEYGIFCEYIANFSSIHVELEGFISPLQYEIIMRASTITPLFLHFSTDMYNVGHFAFLKKDIKPFCRYIYAVATQNLFTKEIARLSTQKLQLYKTTQSFAQANLAIALAHKWQKLILSNQACENDFAIILPNESFANHLITLSSDSLFNFAMGLDIAYLASYAPLLEIYEHYMENKYLDIAPLLDFFSMRKEEQKSAHFENLVQACMPHTTQILTPTILHLESIINLLFADEEAIFTNMIHALATFNHVANREFFGVARLSFSHIFSLFMQEVATFTSNNVGGGKIRVMGALEARNLYFKEVVILDFTDDFVPRVSHDDMFLNSKIRAHYNMPTRLDKENLYKHHYYNIMQNTETTHISFVHNEEKIPSNMLFELGCDIESAHALDMLYSYYDTTKQADMTFYEDEYEPFGMVEHLSASALNVYNDCTRKFYYRYIERLQEEAKERAYFGTIIHNWLYESYAPYVGKILNASSINMIRHDFFARFVALRDEVLQKRADIDIQTFARLDSFRSLMENFFVYESARVEKSCVQILGLECQFSVPHFDFTLHGIIDRIDIVDNEIVLYDYKSGAYLPTKSDLQMPFYALCAPCIPLLESHKDKKINLAYYHLAAKDTKKMLVFCDEKVLHANILKIEEMLACFGNTNEKTDALSTCRMCEYAILCNRE